MIYVIYNNCNEDCDEEYVGYFNNESDAEEYCKILNDEIDKRNGLSNYYEIIILEEIKKE